MSERCGKSQEELPHVCSQGGQPRGATPRPKLGAAAERSYPTSEARGSSWEDLPRTGQEEQPHLQGAVAA